MLVEPAELLRLLGLPEGSRVEIEPLSAAPGGSERVAIVTADGGEQVVFVRSDTNALRANNNLIVLDSLTREGFPYSVKLLAMIDDIAIESWPEGASALQLRAPDGAILAAMRALAVFHACKIYDGFSWGAPPLSLLPPEDLQLHRLGFSSGEREAAREALAQGRLFLAATLFGFCHRQATAQNVFLGMDSATLTNFELAGFGPQLFDVAAFLATCGADAAARREFATAYAEARGLPAQETADAADLATIFWGINELIGLPRRMIEALGDDPLTESLNVSASRIDRALREAAGNHPLAVAIRTALWP